MDSKNKTQSSLCAAERDGTGTWLIPSPVLMAASFAVAESGPSIPAEPKRFSRFYRRNGHSTSLQWQKVGLLYLQNQSASPAFTGGMVIRPGSYFLALFDVVVTFYLQFAVAESGPSIPAEPNRFSRFYRRNGHSTSLQWQKVGLLYLQNQSASPAFIGGMVIRPDESQ
ncbi:hypothetical protein RHSIM_Rhsim12G0157500 [Rhododendron simsii]|uniref:Uncharacterized protein n=1 Tax=Rhododendron simsii TaxID=118357 RepID=A0A834G2S6_RHOSS|nr:hypothetical protein RHSIM_Rhsim12G0157500 [Rhododendron simsii]